MQPAIPIADNIYWVGVNDRITERFENLWPLPGGISYNSYLIVDDKVTLIDAVKDATLADFADRVRHLLGKEQRLDYLIINHMEPDHSGVIPYLRDIYPGLTIVGNNNLRTVADNDVLELGRYRLTFRLTPMVHWPETMMTYEPEKRLLFSGDVFGSFGALDGGIFDDQINAAADRESEILRYFSNVLGRYSSMVQKAFAKIDDLEIATIAPAHGPVWKHSPDRIRRLYDKWSRYETEPGVVVAYASMYGHTHLIMETVVRALQDGGLDRVVVHNAANTHPSYIIRDIWRYRGLLLGTPTYNMRPFPRIEELMHYLENKMIKEHLLGVFGSYGWSGGGVKTLVDFAERSAGGWQLVEPVVEAHGAADANDMQQAELLGNNLARQINGT